MDNKKNVVLFIDSLGSGGAQRQVVNLAVSLKKQNYNVSVVVYLEKSFYKEIHYGRYQNNSYYKSDCRRQKNAEIEVSYR